MTPGRYNAGPTRPRNNDQDTKTGGHLSTQQTADPLLEAYQQAADEELRTRRRFERRLASAERHKHKKAGHAGELTATLHIPRRYWPAVHEAAIKNSIPIRTERLPRHAVTPVSITTSHSGALRLQAALRAAHEQEVRP